MSNTLATYMKIAMTMVVLSTLVIGLVYQSLKETNTEVHDSIENYQIKVK